MKNNSARITYKKLVDDDGDRYYSVNFDGEVIGHVSRDDDVLAGDFGAWRGSAGVGDTRAHAAEQILEKFQAAK